MSARDIMAKAIDGQIDALFGAPPSSPPPALDWGEIVRVWEQLTRAYYVVSEFAPIMYRENEEGLPAFYAVQIGEDWVALLHPDYLPEFEAEARGRGLRPVSFFDREGWLEDYIERTLADEQLHTGG